MNKRYFIRVFFSKLPYLIPASTKLNSGNEFGKSTLENSRIPISRRCAHDSIIFYKAQISKENLGLLRVNRLTLVIREFFQLVMLIN